MGVEIERKYLLRSDSWRKQSVPMQLQQGYLARDRERTVRVRIQDDQAFLTIKGMSTGMSRAEFEYPIPLDEAREMMAFCHPPLIQKTRHNVNYEGWKWEIDEFYGDNAGLIVAEIELSDENTAFPLPPWIGEEVTHLKRYGNSTLTKHPFSQWSEEERTER